MHVKKTLETGKSVHILRYGVKIHFLKVFKPFSE
jgi:hypothetical protein